MKGTPPEICDRGEREDECSGNPSQFEFKSLGGEDWRRRATLLKAYRRHFESANTATLALVRSGRLGELRYLSSTLTVKIPAPPNGSLAPFASPDALDEIGIYCIDAARYLFGMEPTEIFATSAEHGATWFRGSDGAASAIMRFPQGKLASFTVSFGAATLGRFQLVGTRGSVTMDPAYEDPDQLRQSASPDARTFVEEELADLRVLKAIHESVRTHQRVKLPRWSKTTTAGNESS